jgi:outer membrane protein OmpA-like peptidoglycan-associated protein
MKTVLLIATLIIGVTCYAQNAVDPAFSKGYYAIVGTFSSRENATTYLNKLTQNGIKASYGFLSSRKVYYVYTLSGQDISTCLQEASQLRKKPEFFDAWVRFIDEDQKETTPVIVEHTNTPSQSEPAVTVVPETKKEVTPVQSQPEEIDSADQQNEILSLPQMTLENAETFLSLYQQNTDRVVNGKVQVIDTDRGRLITEAKGNSYLHLPDPKSTSGKLTLICDAFGYRKVQHDIFYKTPVTDSTRSFIEEMGTSLIINFNLVRYRKGDIHSLYNVYFYNDAAVLLPESKFELNELLAMMKEGEKMRIRLHGHSNGNYHGKIIKMGPSKNFFAVTEDSKSSNGSAKELSESRAELIKEYLVVNGVDASRIETKAWGGKKPLYDKKGVNAKKNIRVEVEVIGE